jgi:hypothetical protein
MRVSSGTCVGGGWQAGRAMVVMEEGTCVGGGWQAGRATVVMEEA